MQFKHPEILYALAFLIIPLIVHLFQLRRYKKTPFTNVKMLQKIVQHSRKSQRLKKYLILVTRMLALASIIIAFSQPYIAKKSTQNTDKINLYLDNSFSMQAKGVGGELLKYNAAQLIENATAFNLPIAVFTNSETFENESLENLKNELTSIKYSGKSNTLSSKINIENQLNNSYSKTLNKNILITDLQLNTNLNKINFTNVNSTFSIIKTQPTTQNNSYIDSVFLTNKLTNESILNIVVKSLKNTSEKIPISIFNNEKLLGKSTVKFDDSSTKIIQFNIAYKNDFNGKIYLHEKWLPFDNEFYFSLAEKAKINVLSIGESAKFLSKIYTQNEFDYKHTNLQFVNYNNILKQQLIILNELPSIPNSLISVLLDFKKNGGKITIIPNAKIDINSYNKLLTELSGLKIQNTINVATKITKIHTQHPLLKGVFEKDITNFQYPSTKKIYTLNKNRIPVLSTQNKLPFISQFDDIYWVASPLNNNVTNFINSPLVVPIFYNMALQKNNTSNLYYTINNDLQINVLTTIKNNEVLKIQHYLSDEKYIPIQIATPNYVTLNLDNLNLKQGWYNVWKNDEIITTIALNYNRDESNLTYLDEETLVENAPNVTIYNSFESFTNHFYQNQKINSLFKWFLALSILFLLIEIVLLKYFKI